MQIECPELAVSIFELGESKATGLLMIFHQSQVATLGFRDGEATLFLYSGQHGLKAVQSFCQRLNSNSQLTIRFNSGPVGPSQSGMPSLRMIVNILQESDDGMANKHRARDVVPLTEAMKQSIRDVSEEFIGSHSNAICDEVFTRTQSLRATFLLLSSHLPGNQMPADYFTALRNRLRPLTKAFTS